MDHVVVIGVCFRSLVDIMSWQGVTNRAYRQALPVMLLLLLDISLPQAREGVWYPAGLSFSDMRGLAGYKIFLSVALLLGEGAFIMIKAALLGELCLLWCCEAVFAQLIAMACVPACVLLWDTCQLLLLASNQRGQVSSRGGSCRGKADDGVSCLTSVACCMLVCLMPAGYQHLHSKKQQRSQQPLLDSRYDSYNDSSSSSGGKAGSRKQQDLHPQCTSSTSCSFHCSVSAAADTDTDTARQRGRSFENNRQQHQHLQQQEVSAPVQQQQQQFAVLKDGLDVSVDAHAVLPDDPSTSGHRHSHAQGHVHGLGWSKSVGTGNSSINGRGGSSGLRRRGAAQRAAGGSLEGHLDSGVAGATFHEAAEEVGGCCQATVFSAGARLELSVLSFVSTERAAGRDCLWACASGTVPGDWEAGISFCSCICSL